MRASFGAEDVREGSLVHGLDVRTKIFISFSASMAVIFLKSWMALGLLCGVSTLYALELGRWRVVAVCYIAICIMWLMSIGCMFLMARLLPFGGPPSLLKMMVPFMRTTIMVNTILAMALSSRVQTLLAALKSLKLPIWLYVPAAVMIRFIPTFIQDVKQIHEAMKIRGYSPNPVFLLRNPVLSIRLLVAPMLFRALRSADDLGIAAELKGLGQQRTMANYRPQRLTRTDAVAATCTLLILVAGALVQLQFGGTATGIFS